MMHKPTHEDKSTTPYAAALWIWTALVTIGTGMAFGNAFGDTLDFNYGWLFWGLLVGAFSTTPFWVLYGLGTQVLRNLIILRNDLVPPVVPPAQRTV